jgi:UDP-N-acetylglucosamine pyrophosphorylase
MVSPCQQRGTSLEMAIAPSNPLNRNILTKSSARKNVGALREMYRGPRVMRLQAAAGESIREEASHRGTDLDGNNWLNMFLFDVMWIM